MKHDPVALRRQLKTAMAAILPVLDPLEPHVQATVLVDLVVTYVLTHRHEHRTPTLKLMIDCIEDALAVAMINEEGGEEEDGEPTRRH